MVWTLRLYDESGTEIAWVTADPYEYAMTHPDTTKYRFKESSLAVSAEGVAPVHSPPVETEDMTIRHDGEERIDSTPKSHLEYVRDQQLKAPDVDSATLIDE